MSSFDSSREQWELYHMQECDKVMKAAENGDPEAMEILAYHISKIEYNCKEKVIKLLTAASDAGRQTASWKLADYYAHLDGFDGTEHRDKIEHYCLLAFEGGKIYTNKQPECINGIIKRWMEEYHPEWCEKKNGFYTNRYGMNVFTHTGAREKLCDGMRLKITDYLCNGQEKNEIGSVLAPLAVGEIQELKTEIVWRITEVSDTVVRLTVFHPDAGWLKKFTMEKGSIHQYSSRLADKEHEFTLELVN